MLLEIDQLTVRFHGLVAVNQVGLNVSPGQVRSVIGPNGAGKTTVFNAITGIYHPSEGKINFQGKPTELSLNSKSIAGFIGFGLAVGFLSLVLVNIQSLWEASITSNYTYQQPFPWLKAVADGFRFLRNTEWHLSVLPFLIGAAIGSLGSFSVWKQARRRPDRISRLGVSRTFQNIRLFQDMTVLENILVGMDKNLKSKMWHSAFRLPQHWREKHFSEQYALELLRFVDLEKYADTKASNLSYGHQRRLEIARALATKPKLILLDEPAAGMNPSESLELVELIRKIRESGISVLLIEHHMRVVMNISDRITVLDFGNPIAEGTPEEIRSNPKVIEAYLGPSLT